MAKKKDEEKLSATLTGPDGIPHDVSEVMFADLDIQLSLEVEPHPAIDVVHGKGFIAGSISVKGDLRVHRNVNPGDQLIVIVQDADGEILAQGEAEGGVSGFPVIEDKDLGPIGMERKHKATITKDLL